MIPKLNIVWCVFFMVRITQVYVGMVWEQFGCFAISLAQSLSVGNLLFSPWSWYLCTNLCQSELMIPKLNTVWWFFTWSWSLQCMLRLCGNSLNVLQQAWNGRWVLESYYFHHKVNIYAQNYVSRCLWFLNWISYDVCFSWSGSLKYMLGWCGSSVDALQQAWYSRWVLESYNFHHEVDIYAQIYVSRCLWFLNWILYGDFLHGPDHSNVC